MSAIAAWLLEKRVVAVAMGLNVLKRRLHSHSTFFMPCVAATYSLSVVERETISCRLEDHETAPPLMRNT